MRNELRASGKWFAIEAVQPEGKIRRMQRQPDLDAGETFIFEPEGPESGFALRMCPLGGSSSQTHVPRDLQYGCTLYVAETTKK